MGTTPERTWDRVIVGGGVGGLIVAARAAEAGQSVLLLEAAPRVGGVVGLMALTPTAGAETAGGAADSASGTAAPGFAVEWGAESFATKSDSVMRLLEDLGLAGDRCDVSPEGSWIVDRDESGRVRGLPSPKTSLLGIPGDLQADDVVAFLGESAADEARRLDSAPLGRIDPSITLGELVRTRMGEAVERRLVSPVVSGVYSLPPSEIEATRVHPRLLAHVEAQGSLEAAVRSLRAAAPAGAAVAGLSGGMGRIPEALAARALRAGADLRTSSTVLGVERLDGGLEGACFRVIFRDADDDAAAPRSVTCSVVDLALPAFEGAPLVRGLFDPRRDSEPSRQSESGTHESSTDSDSSAGESMPGPGPELALVTLVFAARTPTAAALAEHPRGSGALVAPGARRARASDPEAPSTGSRAKALTHSTAKWSWLRDRAEGREIVRLSYNADDIPSDWSDVRLIAEAVADASIILGVDARGEDLCATGLARLRNAAPPTRPGIPGQQAAADRGPARWSQEWFASQPELAGIRLVGSWAAGTGLAAVVAQAQEYALTLPGTERPGSGQRPI